MSYILHISRHECTACGNAWESSQLFSLLIHGDQRRLEPASEILPGRPFGISRLQPRRTPACYLCAEEIESKLAAEMAESEARWRETLARKAAEGGGSPARVAQVGRRKPADKPAPTLSDL